MKRCILFAGVFLILAACGSAREMPVELEIKKTLRWAIIEVTAVADEVTIEDIIINQGNCQLSEGTYEKKTLKRSQSDTVKTFGCTKINQVKVVTSSGSYDFLF
jgi:hypothetical protein